ncbi:hypothetical protein ANCCAN_17156 [Ancylostoma caninum]|uniref:Nucleotide-diphospho-sugar transferase domain-containing protein n=1 Tax=Ancylostoma caninum TaxID=29170 RepID=A0A368FXN3_ANCCA|nr:hypothetical protein ANCCAN_17156 [Ancylostoma caninum]
MHNYSFRIVKGNEYRHCRHRDTMFRRHCVVAEVLKTTDWVLFIDADIGIVNPTRLIEEFIDTRYDLTFYDRFCSWEVAMGSYIVKNTHFSRNFLLNFANFETHLPDSFHGSDNGAIHVRHTYWKHCYLNREEKRTFATQFGINPPALMTYSSMKLASDQYLDHNETSRKCASYGR